MIFQYMKPQRAVNENYIDNPIFQINQRGNSVYSTVEFTADRWKLINGSVGFGPSENSETYGWTVMKSSSRDMTIRQELPPETVSALNGRNVTLTAIFNNNLNPEGKVYIGVGTADNIYTVISQTDSIGMATGKFVMQSDTNQIFISTNNSNVENDGFECLGIKLEDTIFSQTLAYWTGQWNLCEVPNYATELHKCQRYFQSIKSNGGGVVMGYGYALGANTARFLIPTPAPLASRPSVSFSDSALTNVEAVIAGSSNAVSSISVLQSGTSGVTVVATTTGLSANNPAILTNRNNIAFNFSCEI